MGWFDGFPFKSKEQMEKEERDFEKRLFPLGIEQRDAVAAVLCKIIPAGKEAKNKENLYAFISAKDKYTSCDDIQDAQKAAYGELQRQRWLKEKDRLMILAFVELEAKISDLEQMPDTEAIEKHAELLETQNFV